MLILAVSDLHGELAWLDDVIARHSPDLLLCAGDWGDPGTVTEEQFRALIKQVMVLTIYGNHDDREMLGRLRNRNGMPILLGQGEARRVKGVVFGGISGIWAKTRLGSRLNRQWENAHRRNPSLTLEAWVAGRTLPPYVTDEDVTALADGLAGKGVEVLVTHACPSGLADRTPGRGRGGQRVFRRAFEVVHPRVQVCGHLHRRQRDELPDGRLALNTGHGAEGQGWLLYRKGGRWDTRPLGQPSVPPAKETPSAESCPPARSKAR